MMGAGLRKKLTFTHLLTKEKGQWRNLVCMYRVPILLWMNLLGQCLVLDIRCKSCCPSHSFLYLSSALKLKYFQMQGIECLVTKSCGSSGNTFFSVAKQESKQKGKMNVRTDFHHHCCCYTMVVLPPLNLTVNDTAASSASAIIITNVITGWLL